MFDLFDILYGAPRVYVVTEETLKKQRLEALLEKKKRHEEALAAIEKEVEHLVE